MLVLHLISKHDALLHCIPTKFYFFSLFYYNFLVCLGVSESAGTRSPDIELLIILLGG